MIMSLAACLKGKDINIPVKASGSILEMEYLKGGGGTAIGSGMQYFGGAALTYPPTDIADTASFAVNIAGANAADKDVAITIGADAKALSDNYKNDSITYQLMPDSVYHIINKTVTIKAGSRIAQFQIIFYPSKFDGSKNFMLPVTVTDAQGYTVSSNFGHIYFHTIGNPLAGTYVWDWKRWDAGDSTSVSPSSLSFKGKSTIFLPDNPTTFEVATGYYTGPRYIVKFSNNGGVLTNFSATFNSDDIAKATSQSSGGVTFGPIKVLKADYINKIFQFQYIAYSSGNPRYIVDTYHK